MTAETTVEEEVAPEVNCWPWAWRVMKGLGGLGMGGAIYDTTTIRVTKNAEREHFLFQDVIVELDINFAPRQ